MLSCLLPEGAPSLWRWLIILYGFIFTAMLPDQLGIDVLSKKLIRQVGPDHWLRRGDWVVSIPEHWEFLNRVIVRRRAGDNDVSCVNHPLQNS